MSNDCNTSFSLELVLESRKIDCPIFGLRDIFLFAL